MAIRKTTTRRRKTAAPRRRRTITTSRTMLSKAPMRRRATPRKKGLLSEMFNQAQAQGAAKVLLSGAVGGLGAGLLCKIVPATTSVEMKAVYTLAGGFISAAIFKLPHVGAGMAAVGVRDLMTAKGLLSENMNFASDLDSLPMVLNENEAMFLQENDNMFLADDMNYNVGYFPAGFGGM